MIVLPVPRSRARPAAGSARRGIGAHARLDRACLADRARHLRRPSDDAAGAGGGLRAAAEGSAPSASSAIRTLKVTRIAARPGYSMQALTPAVDVSVGGEIAESGGNAEYALDATALGQAKGLILLGHMMSEDWGCSKSPIGCGRSSPMFLSSGCRPASRSADRAEPGRNRPASRPGLSLPGTREPRRRQQYPVQGGGAGVAAALRLPTMFG